MEKETKEKKEKEELKEEKAKVKPKKETIEKKEDCNVELTSKIIIILTLIVTCLVILTISTIFFLQIGNSLAKKGINNPINVVEDNVK